MALSMESTRPQHRTCAFVPAHTTTRANPLSDLRVPQL